MGVKIAPKVVLHFNTTSGVTFNSEKGVSVPFFVTPFFGVKITP